MAVAKKQTPRKKREISITAQDRHEIAIMLAALKTDAPVSVSLKPMSQGTPQTPFLLEHQGKMQELWSRLCNANDRLQATCDDALGSADNISGSGAQVGSNPVTPMAGAQKTLSMVHEDFDQQISRMEYLINRLKSFI